MRSAKKLYNHPSIELQIKKIKFTFLIRKTNKIIPYIYGFPNLHIRVETNE